MTTFERVAPTDPDVKGLLDVHFALMRAQSPAESCHVMPAQDLHAENIHLFALRDQSVALAVGALRVDGSCGELKSMHTAEAVRGRGLGRRLLRGLIAEARVMGLTCLRLETGSGIEHATARGLYAAEGFRECGPFGDYVEDPLSMYYHLAL